jgi:tRNA (guanine-N7-)-methyltransferase
VPAGEDSLAHRRHVCSRVITQSQYSLTAPLDLVKIFGRRAPLHVDLGCGDGLFVCEMAQRLPDKNFLGIERLSSRIRSSARKAASLDNVRLLQMESSYVVRYLLPPGSVEWFYLLFPDPWPKRRHHQRRIVTSDFLNAIYSALEENGAIYIATDDADYFSKIEKIAESYPDFGMGDADADLPLSRFGLVFRRQGAPIHSLMLRKIPPVRYV